MSKKVITGISIAGFIMFNLIALQLFIFAVGFPDSSYFLDNVHNGYIMPKPIVVLGQIPDLFYKVYAWLAFFVLILIGKLKRQYFFKFYFAMMVPMAIFVFVKFVLVIEC